MVCFYFSQRIFIHHPPPLPLSPCAAEVEDMLSNEVDCVERVWMATLGSEAGDGVEELLCDALCGKVVGVCLEAGMCVCVVEGAGKSGEYTLWVCEMGMFQG